MILVIRIKTNIVAYTYELHVIMCKGATNIALRLYLSEVCNHYILFVYSLEFTFRTVYWAVFGLSEKSVVELGKGFNSNFTERVGYIVFGVYNWAAVIVLLNMLIAMMTRSFEKITVGNSFCMGCDKRYCMKMSKYLEFPCIVLKVTTVIAFWLNKMPPLSLLKMRTSLLGNEKHDRPQTK